MDKTTLENAVIQNFLLYNDNHKYIEVLSEYIFQYKTNIQIYKILQDLYAKNIPIDSFILTEKIQQTYPTEHVEITNHLADIMLCDFEHENFLYYIQVLSDKQKIVKLKSFGSYLQTLNLDEKNVKGIINTLENHVYELSNEINISKTSNIFESTFDDINDSIFNKKKYTFSGYKDLDNLLSFRPGEVTVVAARPGVGKTSFAVSCAINSTQYSNSVLFFSLEMSKQQMLMRIISNISNINLSNLQNAFLTQDDIQRIYNDLIQQKGKFFLVDTPNTSIFDISNVITNLCKKTKLDLIIIDYIQLISSNEKYDNKHNELAKIAQEIKSLSRKLDIPIIILSQLSRAAEISKGRPLLSHLKSSGALEEHFDNVLFLYSNTDDSYPGEQDDTQAEFTKKIQVILAKQRNGPTGILHLNFLPYLSKFKNL